MRTTAIGLTIALVALAAAVLTLGDATRKTAGFVGLADDPPFDVRLVGPLWRDRTLNGGDGAQDFAQVVRDEPLDVEVRGSADARGIAEVESRVDGRRQRLVASRCAHGRCPTSVRLRFVPRLRQLRPGDHRIEIFGRDPHGAAASSDIGAHVSVSRFSVRTVARAPAVVESQPVGKLPGQPGASGIDTSLARTALRVLAAERRTAGLASALGGARMRVVYLGDLKLRGKRLGATMLVELLPPRRDVRAVVPAYVPAARDSNVPYRAQRVRMHVKALRDVLIDVDLARRRVIAFEPGPRSQTLSWSPSRAPAPAGAGDED